MHLTAFRRDPVASKAARNATFNRFVHFLAPLARTGSVSNRGHQDAAWSSSSGTWFDWELGQELWESIGGVGKACNAFPVYNGRLKYLNGKYDIEWRSHYRKHRSDAGWVAREHDWVYVLVCFLPPVTSY